MNTLDLQADVTLRDGTPLVVRAIRPDDAPRLQALHSRLSEQSLFLRFLSFQRTLPDGDALRFASVDFEKNMALVATQQTPDGEQVVGVARYASIGDDNSDFAEAAIVVDDAFQGLGLGTLLLERLIVYARAHGIRAFTASIHSSNTQIMRFIKRSGLPVRRKFMGGTLDYVVYLDEGEVGLG